MQDGAHLSQSNFVSNGMRMAKDKDCSFEFIYPVMLPAKAFQWTYSHDKVQLLFVEFSIVAAPTLLQ